MYNPNASAMPGRQDEPPFAPVSQQDGGTMHVILDNKPSVLPGLPGGPSADARPSEPEEDSAGQVRLSRPVALQDGRTITEIRFREPTMRDALDCGEIMKPVTRDFQAGGMPSTMQVERDPRAIEKWFCRLTGLPSSLFTKISARDGRVIIATIIEVAGDLNVGNLNASRPTFGSAAG